GFVVGDGLLLALAFGVDTVLLDALGHQVGLDGFGAAHGQALVVGVSAHGVGVADGDDHFEVDALDLADQVIELRLAFGIQHRLVKVEEGVRGVGHLGGGGRGGGGGRAGGRCSRSRGGRTRSGSGSRSRGGSGTDQGAVAADGGGGGRPVGVAPAQFVRAVAPHVFAGAVLPVVDHVATVGSGHASLRARGRCQRSGGDQQRHFVQFLHGSPLGEKAAAALRQKNTCQVT